MRTIMLIASVAMIASGVFCIANGSAAFLTVAFIIGAAFLLVGAAEIMVGIRADFDVAENAVNVTKDGIILLVLGFAVIMGQIVDDNTARVMFAALLVIESVISFSTDLLNATHMTAEHRVNVVLTIIKFSVGLYMFFNTVLFGLPATMMIGIAMVLLGLRRFMESFVIEYSRPSFVTGNEEKLREALDEEKRALAKAKEGIREQKNAQRRIQKIRDDIEAERDLMNSAAIRRAERELEKEEDN